MQQNLTRTEAAPGQFMTFTIRNQVYGVPISSVREINQWSEITPVPQTPHFMAGVMNLRGKVIPVVDLRLRLGMEQAQRSRETCIIVIEGDSGQIGMIVDAVNAVMELSAQQIEPAPEVGNQADNNYVMGMGKLENQVIILLSIVECLSKERLSLSLSA